jgi:hypothetical protein
VAAKPRRSLTEMLPSRTPASSTTATPETLWSSI